MTLTPDYWEKRYQEGNTRWDLGQAAPPFRKILSQLALVPGRAVVLGCGRGYDAVLFAQKGFMVTGVDFAPSAVAAAQDLAQHHQVHAEFILRDIFDLLPEYRGCFDYVIEHTCFCALDPELRERYVQLVQELLQPQGALIGLFFTHSRPGGPPFGTTTEQIRKIFGAAFDLVHLEPVVGSIPERQGEEHWGYLQKRVSP